jgi:hypothetical protein
MNIFIHSPALMASQGKCRGQRNQSQSIYLLCIFMSPAENSCGPSREDKITYNLDDENSICNEIPLDETARVLRHAVNPLQANSLHPYGSTLDKTCVKVERGPYSYHDGVDAPAMGMHPSFLLWAAESHPDNPGTRAIDLFNDSGILFLCQVTEWRRVGTCNVELRELYAQCFFKARKAGWGAAIKKELLSGCSSVLACFQHQIGSADTLLIWMPLPFNHPSDGRPIWGDHIGSPKVLRMGLALTRRHDAVYSANTDDFALACGSPSEDPIDSPLPIYYVNRHIENVLGDTPLEDLIFSHWLIFRHTWDLWSLALQLFRQTILTQFIYGSISPSYHRSEELSLADRF